MKNELEKHITEALISLGIEVTKGVVVERPADSTHGDWSSTVALAYAKQAKKAPLALGESLVAILKEKNIQHVKDISLLHPGFINITLTSEYYTERIKDILLKGKEGEVSGEFKGKRVMVEYTDPNPFKVFHIGHLMNNTIGESIACLMSAGGADVVRANYQGDVGLHVAKAIWGMRQSRPAFPEDTDDLKTKMTFVSNAYAYGASQYESDEQAKKDIDAINKEVYTRENEDINVYYDKGRAWSLEHFEEVYALLGTKFDIYYFESEVATKGVEIVRKHIGTVFEESNGAVIYRGEKNGLHTRVFINSQGLPTYDGKDIGLTWRKEETDPSDISVVVSAEEQKEYYKVLVSAIREIDPAISEKMRHVTHGMMQGPDGTKLSSRKGTALTGESLIEEVEELVWEKLRERDMSEEDKREVMQAVSVGAVKYSILRSKTSSNIAFDFDKSISFEGDSGPYLQYTAVRARSVLDKAGSQFLADATPVFEEVGKALYLLLDKFEEVVVRSQRELEPHHIATYAIELASAFNAFYANTPILNVPETPSRLALVHAVELVLTHSLSLLGIRVPKKM
ncbi:MAG: arginine--tRNA ligase [Candidatus Paceibacterota bacterium]